MQKNKNINLPDLGYEHILLLHWDIFWHYCELIGFNPDGCICPRCGKFTKHCHKIYTRPHSFDCHKCKKSFSPLMKSIFRNTRIMLPFWLRALYLWRDSAGNLKQRELQRAINVGQYTACRMLQKIRPLPLSSIEYKLLQKFIIEIKSIENFDIDPNYQK